jgi:hypothetical protein
MPRREGSTGSVAPTSAAQTALGPGRANASPISWILFHLSDPMGLIIGEKLSVFFLKIGFDYPQIVGARATDSHLWRFFTSQALSP